MTFAPVLEKICEWGRKHQARVKTKTSNRTQLPVPRGWGSILI